MSGPTRGATPVAYCLVAKETGSRTILYERSAAAPLRLDEVPISSLRKISRCHMRRTPSVICHRRTPTRHTLKRRCSLMWRNPDEQV